MADPPHKIPGVVWLSAPLTESSNIGRGCPPSSSNRVSMFRQQLQGERIDFKALRALAFGGVPDEKGMRATVWKVSAAPMPF
jgi:hypothetical protein